MFSLSLSLPPLVGGGDGLVCESVGKADLFSDHFDGMRSPRWHFDGVDLPLTCHRSPRLTTFSFRSCEVRHFLVDFYPYVGTDPLGKFPLFRELLIFCLPPS